MFNVLFDNTNDFGSAYLQVTRTSQDSSDAFPLKQILKNRAHELGRGVISLTLTTTRPPTFFCRGLIRNETRPLFSNISVGFCRRFPVQNLAYNFQLLNFEILRADPVKYVIQLMLLHMFALALGLLT